MSDKRVVCPGCSLLCDGLTADSDSLVPLEAQNCPVGSAWFAERSGHVDVAVPDANSIRSFFEQASAALITGVECLTTGQQQAAVKVADRFFAGIDTSCSNAGRGSMLSFQRYGKVTATLGEIANRSDIVILWFCDPAMTHPRFFERFIRNSDKPEKKIIAIDRSETASASLADEFIPLQPDEADSFVCQLRKSLMEGASGSAFLNQMTSATYGSLFVGKPHGTDPEFDLITDQWFQLVRELNNHTRFVMSSLSKGRNQVGANNVLASLCGFPDSVRFTHSGPIYNGLEYSTAKVLDRRECDFLFACDIGYNQTFESQLDKETVDWLGSIPVAVLSDLPANQYQTADVHVPVGVPGWSTSGDFVRTDEIPIPMDALSGNENDSVFQLFSQLTSNSTVK